VVIGGNKMEDDIKLESEQDTDENLQEMNLDNMGGAFIKNPQVGEEIQFTIDKIFKNKKPGMGVDPKTNKPFKGSLSNVEYSIEIHTTDEMIYSPKAWQVVGKLKAGLKHLNAVKGVEVRIKHLLDGMVRDNRGKEIYDVAVRKGNGDWYTVPTKTTDKK
jgi:hypothetical protein